MPLPHTHQARARQSQCPIKPHRTRSSAKIHHVHLIEELWVWPLLPMLANFCDRVMSNCVTCSIIVQLVRVSPPMHQLFLHATVEIRSTHSLCQLVAHVMQITIIHQPDQDNRTART